MNQGERFRRLEDLFHRARELAPEERDGFLRRECGGDDPLRSEIESLLRFHDAEERRSNEFRPGDVIGAYTLRERIGQGGMGVVFLAEQREPVRREVALKVIRREMASPQTVARFESERQALALMDHPHIAKVLDAGATEDGRPYFVMEFVRGVPVTAYCDAKRLDTRSRLGLFARVCDAVQHAHQKGIIHRDLKPSNVLVEEHDGIPVPKVIDFGIAKALHEPLTARTLETAVGSVVGTPEYMSPEQASLDRQDVDTRTDVYALGVVLYELLVGTPPHDPEEARRAGLAELLRRIREEDPPRPSTRVSTLGEHSSKVAGLRGADPGSLRRQLRGDLDWVVMRALERDRERRYASVSDLAADVRRHLHDEPVLAGPPSATYRARKFVRRHRAGVATAATVVLALVLGATLALTGLVRARRAEAVAQAEAVRAESEVETSRQVIDFLVESFRVSDPGRSPGRQVTAREVLDRGAERIETELQNRPEIRARLLEVIGTVYRNLGIYDRAEASLDESIALRESHLGSDHPETADSLFSKALLLQDQGRFEEARETLDRVLSIREGQPVPDRAKIVRALSALGVALNRVRQYDEATVVLQRAVGMLEAAPEVDGTLLQEVLNNLARTRQQAGDDAGARPLMERSLAIARENLPPNHPQIAGGLNNLGTILYRLRDYGGARALFQESLAITEEVLGPDHPQVGVMVSNLASVSRRAGDPDEAERLFLRSMAITERAQGPDHPDIGLTLINLSSLAGARGALSAAREYGERAERLFVGVHGRDHPDVARAVRNLGGVEAMSGRFEAAVVRYRDAAAILVRVLGRDHQDTRYNEVDLATVERQAGHAERAAARLDDLLAAAPADPDPVPPWLPRAHAERAVLAALAGEGDRSMASRRRAEEAFASLGPSYESIGLRAEAAYLAATGDSAGALDRLRELADRGEARGELLHDPVFQELSRTPGFEALRERIRPQNG